MYIKAYECAILPIILLTYQQGLSQQMFKGGRHSYFSDEVFK